MGTVTSLAGLAITAATLTGLRSSDIASYAAYGAGASLAAGVCFDLRQGVRNLIRADVMAIIAFYFLTFFEFLFPQGQLDRILEPPSTRTAVYTVFIAFAGLLLGRHLLKPKRNPFEQTFQREIPPGWLFVIFWTSLLIGYAHMVIAVNFDVWDMLQWMMEPRFSQPWIRGKFGDWKALLVELGLFIYLLPPIAGIAFARRQRFNAGQLTGFALGLALTFFFGFTSGTRNLFAAYLVTFIIGYAFASPVNRRKEVLMISAIGAVIMLSATVTMLRFRNVGFHNWMTGNYVEDSPNSIEKSIYVDFNLAVIGKLTEVFPSHAHYLGWEVPYLALIRPIPRAIWPGKPEGLTESIEEVMQAGEGVTIAASFAGEAYMAGGWIAVFAAGVFFGALTGWWSYLASPRNSELGILIYASGFFAAIISMRSLFVFTTALLPTVAALIITTFALRQIANKARQWLLKPANRPPPPRFSRPPQ
jgi:oligosaccharide repeat unit polymerase